MTGKQAVSEELADIKSIIAHVAQGKSLDEQQAERTFDIIMSGEATPTQIGGILMALRVRGETEAEIVGAARAMRSKMLDLDAPEGAIDVCGTGGDAKGTLNVSSATAFVAAAAGATVAKHGNRAASSKSGAADVLEALGVNFEIDLDVTRKALWENGICFLMAPKHHAAMRHVGPSRGELGTRTIFNLLGPLSNPARVRRQLTGVFAEQWVVPVAEVMQSLGHEKAWVVHGLEGLDELSIAGPSVVAELKNGQIRSFTVTPEDAGLQAAPLDAISGGDATYNAQELRDLLNGKKGPYRDAVLLNTAAALVVADLAENLKEGASMAAKAIDSGEALKKLEGLVAITNA